MLLDIIAVLSYNNDVVRDCYTFINQFGVKMDSKTQMLKAVSEMERIVDSYFGQNLQRELESLRQALESDDDAAISEAISDTIDGCGTATSQIRDLGYALDKFEEAQSKIQSELDAAIEAFENQ